MTEVVEIVEVSPRDGLQNESVILDTATKIEMIGRLVDAGFNRIEVASFVHPKLVPAMADAEDVLAGLPRRPGVSYIGLALNLRGLERAVAAGVDEVASVVSATDGFGMRNQGQTAKQSVDEWRTIAAEAHAAGVTASVVISVAFGCPYEGEVPVERVVELARRASEAGPARIGLGDTIGVADPADVRRRISAVRTAVPDDIPIEAHFHNTRNTGYANAFAAIEEGVRIFDASLGGIGGCPFAPNATGNIATEDLAYMLRRMGFETGLDMAALVDTNAWLQTLLPDSVVGLYARAGEFPASVTA